MKTYEYRGYEQGGRQRKGLVEALSVKDARERLASDGILADRVQPAVRRIRFPAFQRAVFYHELSALLGAGIPMVRALEMLLRSPDLGDGAVLLAGVRDAVREGRSLAASLSEASESFTPFERAIIQVAERSGAVDLMLERLATFLEEQEGLKERVQGALIYPAIVVTVGICVAILMLGLLLPRAGAIFPDQQADMPALTVFMMGLGSFLMRWGLLAGALVAVAVVALRRRIRRDEEFRRSLNRRVFGLPLVGRGYGILVGLRFSRTLSILLQGGVSAVEALELAGEATGSPWMREMAATEAESVRHGSSLSDAVSRMPPLADTLPGWIQVGEASGGLPRLLESAGERYQVRWDRYISRALSFLEPVLILAIGSFVLLITLAVLLPVLSLTQGIGR